MDFIDHALFINTLQDVLLQRSPCVPMEIIECEGFKEQLAKFNRPLKLTSMKHTASRDELNFAIAHWIAATKPAPTVTPFFLQAVLKAFKPSSVPLRRMNPIFTSENERLG